MTPEQETLLETHLHLVAEMASKYAGRGVSLPELMTAGNLGLIEAVEKHRPDATYEFVAFASYYVRQAVMAAVRDQPQPPE